MTAATATAVKPRAQATSLWRDTLAQILRQRSAIIGLSLLAVILLAAFRLANFTAGDRFFEPMRPSTPYFVSGVSSWIGGS